MGSNIVLYSILLAVEKVFRDARRNTPERWITTEDVREQAKKYLFKEDIKRLHQVDYSKRIAGEIHHLYKDKKYIQKLERATYRLNLDNSKVKEWFNKPDSYTDYWSIDGITYGKER